LNPVMDPVVSFNKKVYPYCTVLVGSRSRFESKIGKIASKLQSN